jgi:hypothetical protein
MILESSPSCNVLAPRFEMRAARLIQAEELNRSALITEAELLKNSWNVLIESPDREVEGFETSQDEGSVARCRSGK